MCPRIADIGRVFLFAREPIFLYFSSYFWPQLSEILASFEIELNEFILALRAIASKNLHFLIVVASLLVRGSGDRVRNALSRSVGAIEEAEVVCLLVRIIVDSKIGVFGPCARCVSTTVADPSRWNVGLLQRNGDLNYPKTDKLTK